MRNQKKFLIAFMGPVGSGKSYIAKIFAKKLKGVLIRTDDIRLSLRERKKQYGGQLQTRPNFVINNSKPLAPQILQIVKK